MLLLPDPVTAVEPEAIEPVPEPSVRESDALAGPMAEFGTAEVISWLETVEGLAESELVAIKAKLVKEEFIGQDLIDLTVRSLSRLLRDASRDGTGAVGGAGQASGSHGRSANRSGPRSGSGDDVGAVCTAADCQGAGSSG